MTQEATVASIIEPFLSRLDEVVDRCSQAIWTSVPSYGRSGEMLRSDVREAVRGNVEALSHVLGQGREIARAEMEAIERVGERRAEAGIPLEDVLHAYRTVSRVCWDVLAEECRAAEGDALEATIELAEAILRYTDKISTSVADAYARRQRALVREQEGARREFLSDLLYGTETSAEAILQRAHTLGYDLSVSYIALVGSGPGVDGNRESAVSSAITAAVGGSTADPIVLQKGEQVIALLPVGPAFDPGAVPEKVAAELGGEWRFGMGGPDLGLEGIRRAYGEAREALEIGTSLRLDGPVFRFDDLLLYHFLRVDPPVVHRFVDQMLQPLIEYDDRRKGELLKTLEAYFAADGSVKIAAETLFAHPHTVTYRLRQIERLTGWSLRDPDDKIKLQLAIRSYRLARGRGEWEPS